jgi:AhpD family alkylhydroperoxidase
MQAFVAFDEAALTNGAMPRKHKELVAPGVALPAQCRYCLELNRKAAIAARASKAEIATVAAALRGGAALIHGTHLLGDCRHHHQGAEP